MRINKNNRYTTEYQHYNTFLKNNQEGTNSPKQVENKGILLS